MNDLLPEETGKLRFIEAVAKKTANIHGYKEVITPIVEHYDLLAAKIGEETRKRMYVFKDLGGRQVALRPEFTASIARLVATKMVSIPKPIRLFSFGRLYRYDEPQFGRNREFWQSNFELFGSNRPESDAEILILTNIFLKKIGLLNFYFKISDIGILRGVMNREEINDNNQNLIMHLLDRKRWDDALVKVKEAGGSKDCLEVFESLFKIRKHYTASVFKDIREILRNYPESLESLKNLYEAKSLAQEGGLAAELFLEAGFARGLEYYTGLIFEIYVPRIDIALCGGGRYDKLIELFGGGHIPAVGVAHGIDRLLLALDKGEVGEYNISEERIIIIPVSRDLVNETLKIASKLRKNDLSVEIEVMGRSISEALSDADRRGITQALIVGPREIKEGKVVLRSMKERKQELVEIQNLAHVLKINYNKH
jgi:histidyl-tRNA synthetase